MRVKISHVTRLQYDADVVDSVMDVRLGPRTDDDQSWELFDLRVRPAAAVRRYTDGFGNAAHLITVAKPHRDVELTVRSEVDTLLADPFAPPRRVVEPLGPSDRADFLDPSPLVPAHAELSAIARRVALAAADDPIATAQRLMAYVHEEFTYQPDVTDVSTTVTELLATRTGVCQDLTHVLIGLARAAGIPARYVSGYVAPDSEGSHVRGAGASHAWVECWIPTHGWRGFDPTNGVLASERHVKMAIGRDYRDISPARGTFRGAAIERLAVEVTARAA